MYRLDTWRSRSVIYSSKYATITLRLIHLACLSLYRIVTKNEEKLKETLKPYIDQTTKVTKEHIDFLSLELDRKSVV